MATTLDDWKKALGSLFQSNVQDIGTMVFAGPKVGTAGGGTPVTDPQPASAAGRIFIYVGNQQWVCTSTDFHGHVKTDFTTHHRSSDIPKPAC